MNHPLVGLALAFAIIISAICFSDAWKKSHTTLTDPVAQRIEQLDNNNSNYAQMVKEIVQAAKKDTVVIYRDTCK